MTMIASNVLEDDVVVLRDLLIQEHGLIRKLSQQVKEGIIAEPSNKIEYTDAVFLELIGCGADLSDSRLQNLFEFVSQNIPDLKTAKVKKTLAINVEALSIACAIKVEHIEYEAGLSEGFFRQLKTSGNMLITPSVVVSIALVCQVPTYVITRQYRAFTDWGILWTELDCRGLTGPQNPKWKKFQMQI